MHMYYTNNQYMYTQYYFYKTYLYILTDIRMQKIVHSHRYSNAENFWSVAYYTLLYTEFYI